MKLHAIQPNYANLQRNSLRADEPAQTKPEQPIQPAADQVSFHGAKAKGLLFGALLTIVPFVAKAQDAFYKFLPINKTTELRVFENGAVELYEKGVKQFTVNDLKIGNHGKFIVTGGEDGLNSTEKKFKLKNVNFKNNLIEEFENKSGVFFDTGLDPKGKEVYMDVPFN